MAVLNAADRLIVSQLFQADSSSDRSALPLTKPEFQAAVDALDDFFEANKAAINNAIPLAARTALTAAQKARLLVYVIRRRYEAGS